MRNFQLCIPQTFGFGNEQSNFWDRWTPEWETASFQRRGDFEKSDIFGTAVNQAGAKKNFFFEPRLLLYIIIISDHRAPRGSGREAHPLASMLGTYLIGVWPDHVGSRHINGLCIALSMERW